MRRPLQRRTVPAPSTALLLSLSLMGLGHRPELFETTKRNLERETGFEPATLSSGS